MKRETPRVFLFILENGTLKLYFNQMRYCTLWRVYIAHLCSARRRVGTFSLDDLVILIVRTGVPHSLIGFNLPCILVFCDSRRFRLLQLVTRLTCDGIYPRQRKTKSHEITGNEIMATVITPLIVTGRNFFFFFGFWPQLRKINYIILMIRKIYKWLYN